MKTLDEKATFIFDTLQQVLIEECLPVTLHDLAINDEYSFMFEIVANHEESNNQYHFIVKAHNNSITNDAESMEQILISILNDLGRLVEDEYGKSWIETNNEDLDRYFKLVFIEFIEIFRETFHL